MPNFFCISAAMATFFAAVLLLLSSSAVAAVQLPGSPNCSVQYTTQPWDHFAWRVDTFQQRYLVYDKFYDKAKGGPMLFYAGNEANVELFANWTGWMWTNGPELGALLVFAEHRFFGESAPCPGGFMQCGDYLGTDQALADYAQLVRRIRDCPTCPEHYPNVGAVTVISGSYGGMLAYWARSKYPLEFEGALAGSAPINCLSDSYDGDSYWEVVTRDATAAGGSAPGCHVAVHQALTTAMTLLTSPNASDRQLVVDTFKLCAMPKSPADLGFFVQAQFDSAAMGSYPFSTYYILGTVHHPAPPYPLRKMCERMMSKPQPETQREMMRRLAESIGIAANLSAVPCYDVNDVGKSVTSPKWDFMVCTERMFNEIPYFAAKGPPNDMFWAQPTWGRADFDKYCTAKYGKKPRWDHWKVGPNVDTLSSTSNVIFTNGDLDPWHSGGILHNVSDTVVSYIIRNAGHHLDLFFPTPQDIVYTPDVIWVRQQQLASVKRWNAQWDQRKQRDMMLQQQRNKDKLKKDHNRMFFRDL